MEGTRAFFVIYETQEGVRRWQIVGTGGELADQYDILLKTGKSFLYKFYLFRKKTCARIFRHEKKIYLQYLDEKNNLTDKSHIYYPFAIATIAHDEVPDSVPTVVKPKPKPKAKKKSKK